MGAAAAVIIRKEKELVAHFRSAGAVTPSKAQSPDALGVDTRVAWALLRKRAVIREASPGQFYLDEAAWEALRDRRRQIAIVVAVVVTSAVIASLVAAAFSARRV